MFNAKNGILKIAGDTMDYIAFGNGDKELILLPGLGDGLKTVKGMALVFSIMYLKLAREYKVYVFSRRNNIPSGYSSRDMAKDTSAAMDALDIKKAHIIGISQGGTIAQYLAIDDPKRVDKLVLAVTYARSNKNIDAVLSKWITYANANDYARLFIDTAEMCLSIRNCIKRAPKSTVLGQHRFGFEKPSFCSL